MDSLAMISADFFTDHTKEHLIRISKEFNGLAIHSCGDFSAVIPGINEIPGVDTVNASQMSLSKLRDAGMNPNLFITIQRNYNDIEEEYKTIKQYDLKVEMTINGVWNRNGKMPHYWTESEWNSFRKKEEKILQLSAV